MDKIYDEKNDVQVYRRWMHVINLIWLLASELWHQFLLVCVNFTRFSLDYIILGNRTIITWDCFRFEWSRNDLVYSLVFIKGLKKHSSYTKPKVFIPLQPLSILSFVIMKVESIPSPRATRVPLKGKQRTNERLDWWREGDCQVVHTMLCLLCLLCAFECLHELSVSCSISKEKVHSITLNFFIWKAIHSQ